MPSTKILSLSFRGFRNLQETTIEFNDINIIHGANGSGKSSLLEALYYLIHAKSFRTNHLNNLVQDTCKELMLFSRVQTHHGPANIGISRTESGDVETKYNQGKESPSFICKQVPMLYIDNNCYHYFTDGPHARRQFLNWGLFHMKHHFQTQWRNYNQTLKQRNACLKQRASSSIIASWDQALITLCEEIHEMREAYVDALTPIVDNLLKTLLGTSYSQVQLRYSPGWSLDKPLSLAFQEKIHRDRELGYTQIGAHRADLQLYYKKTAVQDHLSQGQLKLAAYALKLAQCILHKQEQGIASLFLIDDLQAELDPNKQQAIIGVLSDIGSQCFYTALDHGSILSLKPNTNAIKQMNIVSGQINTLKESA